MNKTEVRNLACTDQVREGKKLGLVVCTKDVLKILWDGDEEPETYAFDDVSDLESVKIERKMSRTLRYGKNVSLHRRVVGGE